MNPMDNIDLNDPNPQGDPGALERRMTNGGSGDGEFIDRIEGDKAILLDSKGGTREVPVSSLPPGAKEGDQLGGQQGAQNKLYDPGTANPGLLSGAGGGKGGGMDASSIINSLYAMPKGQ